MPIDFPSPLIDAVKDQRAILFLGAGASFGAVHPDGLKVPDGGQLRNLLCDKFLGGKFKDRTLAGVAEFAISETSLTDVQSFIADLFRGFGPADFHKIVPTFRWHAVVTTNIDLILERAYDSTATRVQELVPFVKDGQPIESELKKHLNGVQFLKLHGCINHSADLEIPFILAVEQYARWSKNRTRLFERLRSWGHELPIIFCGYSINDGHVQNILFDLFDTGLRRSTYYFVAPNIDSIEERYWLGHRIASIRATSEMFLRALDAEISPVHRVVPRSIAGGASSLRRHYRVANAIESKALFAFLEDDVDHIRAGMPFVAQEPKAFYQGYDTGWGAIAANLDAARRINEEVLVDAILEEESDRSGPVDLYLLRGPAGNGKTVCLKRIAWTAADTYEQVVLFLRPGGAIRWDAIEEIHRLCGQRIFLFVDRAALYHDEIKALIERARKVQVPLTMVVAERDNEWNVRCDDLEKYLTQTFQVHYLSESEIKDLLRLLEIHGSLGVLQTLTPEQRVEAFVNRAARQLLVALHETTHGLPFEQIVLDEYRRIIPEDAKLLYLDVCTLNRLGAPVRAGLISRVSGIHFEDFWKRFLMPLEHVVLHYRDNYASDFMYAARHQHIAEMVFDTVLRDPEEKFNQIVRLVRHLDIDYSSDQLAFRQIMRGKTIAQTFQSQDLGRRIFDTAREVVGDDPHLLQQRGIFEMTHPGGSLELAASFIEKAVSLMPYDRAIQHSMALVTREQALNARDPLLRAKLRERAKARLGNLVGREASEPHGYHTAALLALDELRDVLKEIEKDHTELVERRLLAAIREAQNAISEGKQRFPHEEQFMTAEAQLLELVDQDEKAEDALRRSFKMNSRQDWVAVWLAKKLVARGNAKGGRRNP